ncbi:MAG: AAA family ATPase [Leptospiraceae bacterium]|nr:AAA family ATPase [Leptospiraceae bacterium]MCP5503415.1 AAA family ATPase [Leptospiraceae bacterium]
MNSKAIQAIEELLNLLKLEKEAERKEYESLLKDLSLTERQERGVSWYPLIIQETDYNSGGKPVLKLSKKNFLEVDNLFKQGEMVRFYKNKTGSEDSEESYIGIVSFSKEDRVHIILEAEEMPESLEDGRFGLDLYYNEYSYKEMEYALQVVLSADNNRLSEFRNLLTGQKKPEFKHFHKELRENLNESQNRAIQQIHSSIDLCIIHGPPGTGKTFTLVRAIKEILEQEEKHLLACAASNAAVDLLAEHLNELGVNVTRIGNPVRISEKLYDLSLESKILKHQDYKTLKKYKNEAGKIRQEALKFVKHFGRAEREERKEKLNEAKEIWKESRVLERNIIDEILDRTDVVCSTLVGANDYSLKGRKFGTVFIDEASQCLEPANWIPILKAGKLILAGDHCQLPAVIKSKEAAEKGLSKSLFEKCMEFFPEASVLLNTQYRMNDSIMGFSNQKFYEGKLVSDPSVKDQSLGEGYLSSEKLIFIDTAGCDYLESLQEETRSYSNKEEAFLLEKLLKQLLEEMEGKPFSLGILSPYREQIRFFQDLFRKTPLPPSLDLEIDTIDAFQGREKDMIAISLVRSNEEREIGFLADIRRMNVAMTRAKKLLLIIGDSSTISADPFYEDFISYVQEKNYYKSAWEFMD